MKTILTINGSLRKRSLNRQLMREITNQLQDDFVIKELQFQDVPLFNQDIEYPVPDVVKNAQQQVLDADLLLIVTPEYNHQIPGGLKNLLDWLSRPFEKDRYDLGTALKGKRAAVAGVSGRSATGYVRPLLKDLLLYGGMEMVGADGFGVAVTPKERETDVLNLSEEDLKRLKEFVRVIKESLN